MLENACKILAKMQESKEEIKLFCNFSRSNFSKEGFVDEIKNIIDKYKVTPNLIGIIIEENTEAFVFLRGRMSLCSRVLFTKKGFYHITLLYWSAIMFLYYPVIKTLKPYIISMLYFNNTISPHY